MKKILDLYKSDRKRFVFCVLLIGCILCQTILTFYFTMFEGKDHMGIDSSWTYLKTMISVREGMLYPAKYINDTTQPAFEQMLIVLPLMKLFDGNVFASFAVANLIITLLCVLLIVKISDNFGFDIVAKLMVINLFICPYLANAYDANNELGYHECTNGFASYQNTLALALLLIIYFFSIKEENVKMVITGVLVTIGLFLLDVCKGSGLVIWVGVALLLYVLINVFIENDYKVILRRKNLFLVLFVIAMVLGSFVGRLIGYEYFENNMNWIDAEYYFKNLGNVIICFANMLGGVPTAGKVRNPMTFDGYVYCFGIIISLVFYISVGYAVVKTIKGIQKSNKDNKVDEVALFLTTIVLANIFIFSFLISWGSIEMYSIRYLIPPAQVGFILVGYFINSLDSKLILRRIGVVALFVGIVGMNLYSDYYMAIYNNDRLMLDELVDAIDEKDGVGLVYFWDEGMDMLMAERVIRVVDFDRVYKSISNGNELQTFGDYSIYDDSTTYSGPTVIVTNGTNEVIPAEIRSDYSFMKKIGDYALYYCAQNPVDTRPYINKKY